MAKKDSTAKQLRAKVNDLAKRLKRVEAKALRWKGKAREHEKSATAAEKRAKTAEKKLPAAPSAAVPTAPLTVPHPAPRADAPEVTGPGDHWTVKELRNEARVRGVTGYSRKSKSELIALLKTD
jgi:hypothetical protein